MHYPLKVADLKKKLNKLRYETGRKTSRIEALMKQYEKVWKIWQLGQVFAFLRLLQAATKLNVGRNCLRRAVKARDWGGLKNFSPCFACFNLVGLHNPVTRFTHLVEVLFVLVYMASNLFKVPRERDPQNQLEADGRGDNQEEVHEYPRHAEVITQIHPITHSMWKKYMRRNTCILRWPIKFFLFYGP